MQSYVIFSPQYLIDVFQIFILKMTYNDLDILFCCVSAHAHTLAFHLLIKLPQQWSSSVSECARARTRHFDDHILIERMIINPVFIELPSINVKRGT